MNILLAPAHYMLDGVSGGSEYGWAYHIVDTLAAQPGVRLFVLTGIVKSEAAFPPNVTLVRLDRRPVLNLTPAYTLAFIARYYAAALRVLRRHHIDIIHHVLPFGYGKTFNPLPLLGHTRTIPFIVGPLQSPHTVEAPEEMIYSQGDAWQRRGVAEYLQEKMRPALLTWSWSTLARLSARTLQRSAYLVAVNEQARALYAASAPNVPTIVIPPGVDGTRFGHITEAGRSESEVELLYVGWLISRKGVDVLIDAFARLAPEFPSLRLRIVGDGPQRQALEDLARRHGLDGRVIFEGAVANANIAACYARANIFVSMSYSESFGQSLVEAMLSGLPVISAENIGSREIIDEGETGFLVPPGDVESLIARLRLLIADPRLRAAVGGRARDVAGYRYNWSRIGRQYIDVYQRVLRARADRAQAASRA